VYDLKMSFADAREVTPAQLRFLNDFENSKAEALAAAKLRAGR